MVDINKLVENYFQPKNEFDWNHLLHLIREQMAQGSPLREIETDPGEEKTIDIKFPILRITEDFGALGTEDRIIIEKFTKNITGDTLEEKINVLNNILTTKKEDATVGEILSTMVVCEILSAIITRFTESAGGFIFEGFLAGLFGGKSVQITKPEDIEGMKASGKPITDVVLGDKHYSLKLLGKATEVKGSFRNMVNHFETVDHIIYLDARRINKDQGLQFGEFIITLDNFLEVFVDPFLSQVLIKEPETVSSAVQLKELLGSLIKNKQAIKEIKTLGGKLPGFNYTTFVFSKDAPSVLNEKRLNVDDFNKVLTLLFEMPSDELDQYAPFEVRYAESKFEKTKAERYFGSFGNVEKIKRTIASGNKEEIIAALRDTPGYTKPDQFKFTREQAESIKTFRVIGTLMIGKEYMKETFAMYADLLRETISPVYEQLQYFTNNINDYFLGVSNEHPAQDRKRYALDAIKNAQELEVVTNQAVEKIEK